MKLSEAIREGCKYGPQLFGLLTDYRGGTCAIGSALLAHGNGQLRHSAIQEFYPWVAQGKPAELPCGCHYPLIRYTPCYRVVIAHLNDKHKWSREAIAEWVETVERKLGLWDEPKVEAPVVQEAIKASLETVNK